MRARFVFVYFSTQNSVARVCVYAARYGITKLKISGGYSRRKRSRYFKPTPPRGSYSAKSIFQISLCRAFSRIEDNFFQSFNTVSARMSMRCSGARAYDAQWTLCTGSRGGSKILFWLFCLCILDIDARWSEVTGKHGRVKYDKACERASELLRHSWPTKQEETCCCTGKSSRIDFIDETQYLP